MGKVILTPEQFIFLNEQDFFTCELSVEEIMETHGDEKQSVEDVVDHFEFLEKDVRYVLNGGGICANKYQYSGINLDGLRRLIDLSNIIEHGDIVVDPDGAHFLIYENTAFYVGQDVFYERDWLVDGKPAESTIFTGKRPVPNGQRWTKKRCVWQKNKLVHVPVTLYDFHFNGSIWAVKNAF